MPERQHREASRTVLGPRKSSSLLFGKNLQAQNTPPAFSAGGVQMDIHDSFTQAC